MKIKNKLVLCFLTLLILSFVLSAISLRYILYYYSVQETREEIKKEASLVADSLANAQIDSSQLGAKIQALKTLKQAGQFLDTHILILDKNDKPVYTNTDQTTRQEILRSYRQKARLNDQYIIERFPINNGSENIGTVIVAAESADISAIYPRLYRSQIVSFLLAGLIAIIIASLLSAHFTRGIDLLIRNMHSFSVHSPYKSASLKTGDELEDLSNCFDELAARITDYDERQKLFMQNTSHELKTPLMSIQGYAEAIRDGMVQKEAVDKSLEVIIAESQRLKKTVDEFIYLSKLETPGDIYRIREVAAAEVVYNVFNKLRAAADLRSIKLSSSVDENTVISVDQDKIEKALYNIVDNSVRYAASSVDVNITAKNDQINIIISDDGPGFSPGEELRVFDRFYKGSNGGSGIGLSISRAVIEGHGGSIGANGIEGGGAQFIISLPA